MPAKCPNVSIPNLSAMCFQSESSISLKRKRKKKPKSKKQKQIVHNASQTLARLLSPEITIALPCVPETLYVLPIFQAASKKGAHCCFQSGYDCVYHLTWKNSAHKWRFHNRRQAQGSVRENRKKWDEPGAFLFQETVQLGVLNRAKWSPRNGKTQTSTWEGGESCRRKFGTRESLMEASKEDFFFSCKGSTECWLTVQTKTPLKAGGRIAKWSRKDKSRETDRVRNVPAAPWENLSGETKDELECWREHCPGSGSNRP